LLQSNERKVEKQTNKQSILKELVDKRDDSLNDFLKVAYPHPVEEFMNVRPKYFRTFTAKQRLDVY